MPSRTRLFWIASSVESQRGSVAATKRTSGIEQHRTVQRGAAGMLHKVPAFFVPEIAPDIRVDRLACLVPAGERCRQRAFGGQADRTVQRHPAHQPRVQEVVLLAAHFPDTHVFAVPDITDLIREFDRAFPAVVGNGFAVFVDQINRIHQLAVDVQLDLVERLIADTHRRRAAMPAQVRQLSFRQLLVAVDAIQDVDLDGLVAAVADPPSEPTHVVVGFVDKTQAHERVDRERGVTDPGVTVVQLRSPPGDSGRPKVAAAMIAPCLREVKSFRARAERLTISRQRPR